MAFKLICALLVMMAYTKAASVVKRQIFPQGMPGVPGVGGIPLSAMEDPLEPSELGDGGVTLPPPGMMNVGRNLPFGAGTINPLSEMMREPAELTMAQYRARLAAQAARVAPAAPARVNPPPPPAAFPALPPGFELALLQALRQFQQSQQAAGAVGAAPRAAAGAAPAGAAGAPAAPAPQGVVDTPPAGAAAQSNPPAAAAGAQVPPPAGQSSIFVVPGQEFAGTGAV